MINKKEGKVCNVSCGLCEHIFKAGYESRDEELKGYIQSIKDLQEQRKVSASIKVDLESEVKKLKNDYTKLNNLFRLFARGEATIDKINEVLKHE
jgi:septal ring factor EnvC (AmiA/AmiB activator)